MNHWTYCRNSRPQTLLITHQAHDISRVRLIDLHVKPHGVTMDYVLLTPLKEGRISVELFVQHQDIMYRLNIYYQNSAVHTGEKLYFS